MRTAMRTISIYNIEFGLIVIRQRTISKEKINLNRIFKINHQYYLYAYTHAHYNFIQTAQYFQSKLLMNFNLNSKWYLIFL